MRISSLDEAGEVLLSGLLPGERAGPDWAVEDIGPPVDRRCLRLAGRVVLELKSMEAGSPVDALSGLLDELTVEMGAQFRVFRKLRADAEAGLGPEDDDGGAGGNKAGRSGGPGSAGGGLAEGSGGGSRPDGKTARADIKGATDAMSLIVRTLEKIDSLKRDIARDRAAADLQRAEEEDDAVVVDRLAKLIDARANERAEERARDLVQRWRSGDGDAGGVGGRAGAGGGDGGGTGAFGTGPPGKPGDAPAPGGGGAGDCGTGASAG
ncbi:hypothetical protein J5J10_22245 [Ciceribacter sp. L1K23]|uniref:hypothetical protein n=1 Tax=Ciceribacter sp. L1K23 TaxID=2820276 RepID=UPI001B81A7D7|nr:hypothetical protein [Ciceribacter sp. L1K23]MBR0558426.1 hypothetical protein [Ciceribacter sp. L1K23]